MTVSGAIQSEGTAASIEASGEDSDVTFKSGNVTVQTEHENWSGYGVDIWTSNHATVNAETGSVSAPGEAVNVYAEEQSEAHVTVNGDAVSRDDNGVQIWAGENSTADVTVTVNGDVTSADEGLALSVDDTSTADILVTGTLYGKNCGVGGGISEGGKVTLTTWKLDSSSYNNQVKVNPTQEFRAGINYIVKIADSDKDTLTAYNGDDSELAQSHGYGVAHEDQTVRVKVAAMDGYEVVGVYNGEGDDKTELTKDAAGSLTFSINSGFAIRRADGAVISGSFEMIDDVPALVNDAGEQAVLNEAGELCFDPEAEDGAITLSNVTQRYLRVVFPDGHEEEGSFDLVDDVLVLVNAGATNMPVGEDGRVTFTSMDGPQQSIEATLDPMTIAVLRAALG